ncbi:MAG: hypothetical protein II435_01015 [Bacteroidales bacterium]|nr:hypothetical protein [Bacteroidales bacterium]
MSVLGQCMEILNLTSLAWKGRERYSVVAHSFRVMAKAKNFDEMVVGMMHELYAASSYTRGLYHCDVDGDPQWGISLDFLTPKFKKPKLSPSAEIPDDLLLGFNMPRGLIHPEQWIRDELRWNAKYYNWILTIAKDRIARNVMIYDLEDKLDILLNPKKYVDELGPQWFVLPWKKHYCVPIQQGKSMEMSKEVPHTDDPILLRELEEEERNDLIEKYTRARDYLRWMEDQHPAERTYSKEQQQEHANICNQWFNDWVSQEEELKEMYGEDCEDSEDTIPVDHDRPSC